MYSFNTLQIIRRLDSLLFVFAAIIIIIVHPSIGRNELGQFDIFCMVPCIFLGWLCYQIPLNFENIPQWKLTVFSLRFFAVTLMIQSPFVVWWIPMPNNVYFFINAQIALCCGISFLFYLTKLVLELAKHTDAKSLAIEAKIAKTIIFYFILIPFISFMFSLILDYYTTAINTYNDFYFIFTQFPHWFRWMFIIPLLICMNLIFRIRIILTDKNSRGANEYATNYTT